MTKGRDNQAARLRDLLELIQARRQSGLLSVERFEDERFEEGNIYFEQGRPVHIRAGDLSGEEALAWLAGWKQVYFSFSKGVLLPGRQALAPPGDVAAQPGQDVPRGSRAGDEKRMVAPVSAPGGMAGLVPQKLKHDQSVLSLPLTRPQRAIYLLVDGRRTIADLARCTRKSVLEVLRLLNELQEQRLVSLRLR
jgi:hypothetical protein